jgi:putative FmdB family regulatory protein
MRSLRKKSTGVLKNGANVILSSMPTYVYRCISCGVTSEIVKSIKLASQEEICDKCQVTLDKVYTPFQILGARVENAEFNPGLGCVVKNSKHRKEIADRKGLVEVGNETPDTLYKETVVKKEKQREREWNDL